MATILQISGLKKGYRSPDGTLLPVIDVPEFRLESGAQVALKGSSGSGKTTFLNLIAGILQPDAGSILILDHDICRLSESARDRVRADSIGYVFQTFNLLQGYTALENVLLGMMFGPGRNLQRAKELLERVGLKDRMHYKPRQLSVGQQQRVAVARALANQPKLVLADEPTGNLDQRHSREAIALIRGVCSESGAALLLVTHDVGILKGFEQVSRLADINLAALADEAEPAAEGALR